jgi:hypothetical protein
VQVGYPEHRIERVVPPQCLDRFVQGISGAAGLGHAVVGEPVVDRIGDAGPGWVVDCPHGRDHVAVAQELHSCRQVNGLVGMPEAAGRGLAGGQVGQVPVIGGSGRQISDRQHTVRQGKAATRGLIVVLQCVAGQVDPGMGRSVRSRRRHVLPRPQSVAGLPGRRGSWRAKISSSSRAPSSDGDPLVAGSVTNNCRTEPPADCREARASALRLGVYEEITRSSTQSTSSLSWPCHIG